MENVMSQTRPSFGKMILFSLLSIAVTFICGMSFIFSFGCVVGRNALLNPGFMTDLYSIVISELGYFAGGYVFGTLTKGVWKVWAKALVLVAPNFLFRSATFVLAFYNLELQKELLNSKEALIVLPALIVVLSPFVAIMGIGAGESSAEKYNFPNSVLNIGWFHWFWILPFYLFSVTGVTSFLFFLLFKFDANTDSGSYFSIFSIFTSFPTLFVRFLILACIGLAVTSISALYSILSRGNSKAKFSDWAWGIANWLFLTIIESLILMSFFGQSLKSS